MKSYTVFGICADNLQRHSMALVSRSPGEAEGMYRKAMGDEDMLVAAVVEGIIADVSAATYADAVDAFNLSEKGS